MAKAFIDKGYKIISDGTDNHSMLIDLRKKFPELTGKVAEKALVAADITVNKNMVPFDSRSAFQTSGIRVGTPAITTRGAKEPLMAEIVELIDTVLSAPNVIRQSPLFAKSKQHHERISNLRLVKYLLYRPALKPPSLYIILYIVYKYRISGKNICLTG